MVSSVFAEDDNAAEVSRYQLDTMNSIQKVSVDDRRRPAFHPARSPARSTLAAFALRPPLLDCPGRWQPGERVHQRRQFRHLLRLGQRPLQRGVVAAGPPPAARFRSAVSSV